VTTRVFLAGVYEDGAEHLCAPDWLVIEVSPEMLAWYHRLRGMACDLHGCLKRVTTEFHCLSVWDWQPSFFVEPEGLGYVSALIDANRAPAEDSGVGVVRDGGVGVEITPACHARLVRMLEAAEEQDELRGRRRMGHSFAEVDEEGIRWRGCVRHCDYEVVSDKILWTTLFPEKGEGDLAP